MDTVRRYEMCGNQDVVRESLGDTDRKVLEGLLWCMSKNPVWWNQKQWEPIYWLQRSNLKSARAWRLRQALLAVYAEAVSSNDHEKVATALRSWLSWARRCRLGPFKHLAKTLAERFVGVLRGMPDRRSNAYVEAMNGLLQQT